MKGFLRNLKYLDLFPEDTGFVHEGKKNYRSYLGVFLSLFLVTASVVVGFMFGKEVYLRNHPNVSMSREYLEVSEVDMRKWPIVLVLSDGMGRKLNNDNGEYYQINVGKMNYTKDNEVDFVGFPEGFNISRCVEKDFEYSSKYVARSEIDLMLSQPSYCIRVDQEGFFKNPYKSPNSGFIIISVNVCDTSSKKCADDYEYVMPESYVQMYFINTYIDSLDFDNPVKYFYDSINQQVTNTILKRNYVKVVEDVYISDNGWLVEDINEVSYYSLLD